MTIEVQQVSEAHKEGWLAMWQGYLTFYKEDLPAEQTELTWQRLLDPAFNMHGFVAIHDGLVVGLTNYSWTNSSWDVAPNIYLEDLFVDENLRGGGIGRSLIDAVTHVAHVAVGVESRSGVVNPPLATDWVALARRVAER